MRQFNFLRKLLDVQPDGTDYVSIYLNTEPNETGKKDHDVFIKKQLNDHIAVRPEGSAERDALETMAEGIRAVVEDLDPATRGVAIFARAGTAEPFSTFEFAVPFEKSEMFLFARPHLYPLVRLMDRNPTFVVVAADTNTAHIHVFKRAEEIRREDIQNPKTNRSEVGGWSQMRFQRHVENFHHQHAKEVVGALDRIVRDGRVEHVVLAGDPTGIIPLLKSEMSEELQAKIVDSLPLNVNTPEHELENAGRDAVTEYLRRSAAEDIGNLREVDYEGGNGVTGVERTLAALLNGQVQELYLSSDPEQIVFRKPDLEVLLKNYEPGLEDQRPDLNDREMLVDELIRQAAASADSIKFIDDERLLGTSGGVGAVLRYQAKGVTGP